MLLQHVKSGVEVDLAFMNKKIDYFNQLNGLSIYSVILNYSARIEQPRYIVAAFQTIDKSATVSAATEWSEPQNVNHSIFNGTYVGQLGPSRNSAMIDVDFVSVQINGENYQLMDYNNNFNENRNGRRYNEF